IENSVVTSITSKILFQLHPKKKAVEIFKKNQWVSADVSQVKKGELVRIFERDTIPLDGVLESETATINNHLMSGESYPVHLKNGDHIFAGAVAQSDLQLLVTAPQGERKIDAWAETALLSEDQSKYKKLFSKTEASLVSVAF